MGTMKIKLLAFALLLFSGITMAQDNSAELKNQGNDALRSKNYKGALAKYEAYLATGSDEAKSDYSTIYNAATCSYKLKNYAKSNKYYAQAKANGYKEDLSTYKMAMILKKQNKEEESIAMLEQAITDYSSSKYKKNFVKAVATHYTKQAQVPYNEAIELSTKAGASGDGLIYLSTMKKAFTKFEESKPIFDKILSFDPTNAAAKAALKNMVDEKARYEKYKETLSANK